MYLQTALLVCCMLISGESAIVRHLVLCDDLKACLTSYDVYGDPSEPSNLAKLKMDNEFDNYCTSLRGMDSCVAENKGSCRNEDEVLQATTAVQLTNYICAAENRPAFLELASLENTCLDDPTLEAQLVRDIAGCSDAFERSVVDITFDLQLGLKPLTAICPLVDRMGTCIDNKVKAVCEPKVSAWFTDLINHSISINTNQVGCPARTTTKRLVQRSFAMLRKS